MTTKAYPQSSASEDEPLLALVRTIVAGNHVLVQRLVRATPGLATQPFAIGASRATSTPYFLTEIAHYIYAGDTALHLAAAAYTPEAVRLLVEAGARPGAANRRRAQPLHYAADGGPTLSTWDPQAQKQTVSCLVEAGADPNALDSGGVSPLHRAVRCRCTGAVRALLACGADRNLRNKSGSTPLMLAAMTTGRGGSGSAEAKREQAEILRLLRA